MCTAVRTWKKEIIEETTDHNTINHAKNLILNEGFSIERALSALGVPSDKHSYYAAKLKTMATK